MQRRGGARGGGEDAFVVFVLNGALTLTLTITLTVNATLSLTLMTARRG